MRRRRRHQNLRSSRLRPRGPNATMQRLPRCSRRRIERPDLPSSKMVPRTCPSTPRLAQTPRRHGSSVRRLPSQLHNTTFNTTLDLRNQQAQLRITLLSTAGRLWTLSQSSPPSHRPPDLPCHQTTDRGAHTSSSSTTSPSVCRTGRLSTSSPHERVAWATLASPSNILAMATPSPARCTPQLDPNERASWHWRRSTAPTLKVLSSRSGLSTMTRTCVRAMGDDHP